MLFRSYPLDGVVETDWLPFIFTMNWRFSKPGKVKFEKGEPFCFLTLMPHSVLDDIEPTIEIMDGQFAKEYSEWAASRANFNHNLEKHDSETVKQGWQKNYVQGSSATGQKAEHHVSKRKLNPFRENL